MDAEFRRIARRACGKLPPAPQRTAGRILDYPFDPDLAKAAACYLRTPSRVLWTVYAASQKNLEALYRTLRKWCETEQPEFMKGAATVSVHVKKLIDFPAGPLQVRGTVKNALVDAADHLGQPLRLDPEDPDLSIFVYESEGQLFLALDLLGQSMHRRGYRQAIGVAPLKETLAAQMLMLTRWDPRTEALLDPMAGAGTIVLEAGQMAKGQPLWPDVPRTLRTALGPVDAAPLFADADPRLYAIEADPDTARALDGNRARAHVAVELHGEDFRDFDPKRLPEGPGLILSNPPYGERLHPGDEEILLNLYEDLGHFCRALGPGWRSAFLVAHPEFEACFGQRPESTKGLRNGRLPVRLVRYRH